MLLSMDAFLPYMEALYRSAVIQTHNESTAEELVQEVCLVVLQALSRGAVITNPKAYLHAVLRNRFFMAMREKYKLSVVHIGDMPYELSCETDFSALERSEEAKAVRRELAFLSKSYRDEWFATI